MRILLAGMGAVGSLGITGLGLVASGKRNIKSGYEFESLYNTSGLVGTNPIIGGDESDTYDTLNHMANIVRSTLIDTKKVAAKLEASTTEQTLRNIWNHVYHHFQYEKDANGIEQIRRPARSFKERRKGIDCDCMSVVISSLLHNLSKPISHTFRKAAYNEDTGWQHVYVIVPKKGTNVSDLSGSKHVDRSKYYVLDCVVDKFDYEVPYIKKFDKVMKVQYLNGLDAASINGGISPSLSASLSNVSSLGLLYGLGCEFDGLEALDGVSPNAQADLFLRGLKKHLENTRAVMRINPGLTAGIYDPILFAQRLDALIAAFDNAPLRNKVLGQIIAQEDAELSGLSGGGLGAGFFKKVGQGIKKAAKSVATGVKTAVKAVAKFVVRYNPATIAIRSGMLLAMKINLFRQAEKLGYGLWDDKKATEKGLDLNEFKKTKDSFNKVVNIYKKLGGKQDKIVAAIKKGWEHGVKKHNLLQGLDATAIAKKAMRNKRIRAASPLIEDVDRVLRTVDFKTVKRDKEKTYLNDFFQAVRTNRAGLATKLSLAYKPGAEAKSYNQEEYRKLLESTRKIESLITRHGGSPQQLLEAIEAGKKVAMTSESLGEVAAASTAAASGILATIATFLRKINFKTLFKGKADSPHFVESEMKKFDVSQPMDDDLFDEGDPNNTAVPVEKILSDYTQTDAIVESLTTKPNSNTFVNMLPAKVQDVVERISHSDAARLVQQIKNSPVVAKIAATPLAQALLKKVRSKTQPAPQSTQTNVSEKYYQDAQVVDTKINSGVDAGKVLKYTALVGGSALGLYLIFKPKKQAQPAPAAAPAAKLEGVKKSKSKSSQRAPKKVMAITI